MQSKNQVPELEGPGGIAVDEHDRLAPALVDVMHGLAVLGFKLAALKGEHFVRHPVRPLGGRAGFSRVRGGVHTVFYRLCLNEYSLRSEENP